MRRGDLAAGPSTGRTSARVLGLGPVGSIDVQAADFKIAGVRRAMTDSTFDRTVGE